MQHRRHRLRRAPLVLLLLALVLVLALRSARRAGWRLEVGGRQPSHNLGSSEECSSEKAEFLRQHPNYGYHGWIDAHWQEEVGSRMAPGSHYLDFTGSGLYTNSQLRAASRELEGSLFGNPHSTNPSSMLSTAELADARARVLAHFSADPEEYAVVFVRSATEALKLVGEYFPWAPRPGWQPERRVHPGGISDAAALPAGRCGTLEQAGTGGAGSSFVYLRANHKSVLGIGAYAKLHGSTLACVDEPGMEAWLASKPPEDDQGAAADDVTYSLVAYPSKDNLEGRMYPLDWIQRVHSRSTDRHKWMVVLDAAAHVATHPLDLRAVKPDFVCISFYKIFGLPTGVGALLARRKSAAALRITYFGGGSVVDATAEDVWRVLMPLPEGLEAGTPPFLDILQLKHGFDMLRRLGGMPAIEAHVESLRAWTAPRLAALRHPGGAPLLRLFGAHGRGPRVQSGVFAFLVLHANGSSRAAPWVQQDAAAAGLHVRSGCVCNPGQCHYDVGLRPEEARARALDGARAGTDDLAPLVTVARPGADGRPARVRLAAGVVRASLGPLSTFEDVCALLEFLRGYRELVL
ncbi:hypothetical protein MNEG_7052 [Monoraphidium neglectum]|uniref:Aminotransferase class V domain-containing protein n=1 Tax=Monoraphidium neglectum TaxID=145388 RepID=A0A0D2MJV1_9CHLO|nr:hypothetical protein MNEG_7052 [Monoraphidium neglectum]KIZ00907.1 hypothetical protein MNEG_7052 [Monoraphidium neglectum]|eukprot:XP_013899926.1 hypothetical protein MNEG_7052 [Monoraphidium neglectum]